MTSASSSAAAKLFSDNSTMSMTETRSAQELYSGKWVAEEEAYVEALTAEFLDGSLSIPEGTSLRFFLGTMLGCKPKRVSKKYERKTYHGKALYIRSKTTLSKEEKRERQSKLMEIEAKFRQSRTALNLSYNAAAAASAAATSNALHLTRDPPPAASAATASAQGAPRPHASSLDNCAVDALVSLGSGASGTGAAALPTTGITGAGTTGGLSPGMLEALLHQRASGSSSSSFMSAPSAASSLLFQTNANTNPGGMQQFMDMNRNMNMNLCSNGSNNMAAIRQHLLRQQIRAQLLARQQEELVLKELLKRKFLMANMTNDVLSNTTMATTPLTSNTQVVEEDQQPNAKRFKGASSPSASYSWPPV